MWKVERNVLLCGEERKNGTQLERHLVVLGKVWSCRVLNGMGNL